MSNRKPFDAEAVKAKLRQMAARFPDKAKAALRGEGEMIMTRSKRDFVPVDLGALRSSGVVSRPERRGKEITVVLSFGGASAPYAIVVHEHPSSYDPPSWRSGGVTFHPTGRGPKYLERPMLDAIPGMTDRIATVLSKTI